MITKGEDSHMKRPFSLIGAVAVSLIVAGCADDRTDTVAPDVSALTETPRIAPPGSTPYGKTYGQWVAAWWKWALETPASINPVLDVTGKNCQAGQHGDVWFLAGSFGSAPVTRECTIPRNRALLFPVINQGYGAFLNDPPDTRTEDFIRGFLTCIETAEIHLIEIDGVPVENPKRFLEKSPIFEVQLPEDNIFGAGPDVIPELILSPFIDEGYYLLLRPREPGRHTIRWHAEVSACVGPVVQDITYKLKVQ